MKRIAVIGSANIDYVARVNALPRPGETVMGGDMALRFGGKGANQAVAARRLGAPVVFVGKLGNDNSADLYLERLRKERIDTQWIGRSASRPNGCAFIFVDAQGQNQIVVSPGANADWVETDTPAVQHAIQEADILLLQLEIPLEVVSAAIHTANAAGKTVILNPSPITRRFRLEGLHIEYLIVNGVEAEMLSGLPLQDESGLDQAAATIQLSGAGAVIVTLGEKGVFVREADGKTTSIPGKRVQPVDTVGAGDTFAGALAAGLAEGLSCVDAARLANAAAALSTLKLGAQEAMPPRDAVIQFMNT